MRKLVSYLPDYYLVGASPEVFRIQEAFEFPMAQLWADRAALEQQLTVDTATWGLECWEEALGLSTDPEAPLELRRQRVKAKLQAGATTTLVFVKELAENWLGEGVTVTVDSARYLVRFRFVPSASNLDNLDELSAALREVMPAHLRWTWFFAYRAKIYTAVGVRATRKIRFVVNTPGEMNLMVADENGDLLADENGDLLVEM